MNDNTKLWQQIRQTQSLNIGGTFLYLYRGQNQGYAKHSYRVVYTAVVQAWSLTWRGTGGASLPFKISHWAVLSVLVF